MNRSEITLLKNETLIWGQSRKKNLLGPRYVIPIIGIAFNLIILILTVWVIMLGFIWASLIFIFLMVIEMSLFIWYPMNYVKKLRKNLKLSDEDLKNYEVFDLITNQRYIRRHYYLNFYRDYSAYSKDIYEIIDDVFFLNLKSVKIVIFFFVDSRISLEPDDFEPRQDFDIKLQKDKKSDFPVVREALINLLDLEFIDGEMGYEEIYRSKFFNTFEHPFEKSDAAEMSRVEKWGSFALGMLFAIGGVALIVMGAFALSLGLKSSWVIFFIVAPLGAVVLVLGLLSLLKLRKEILKNK